MQKKESKGGNKTGRKNTNKEFGRITYAFVTLFLVMMGYIVYFNAVKSSDIINSPYNTRQDTFADRVQRGNIIASDGTVLAETVVDEKDKETRSYPFGDLYAHVVGYASNGKSGIESTANFQLLTSNTDYGEKVVNEFKQKKNIGDNVVTTLVPKLQQAAYDALGANKGAAVAIEPKTGKILAMVSKPSFDPNKIGEQWDALVAADNENSELLNRASQGQYPPGSIFKVVTALAYMRDQGDVDSYSFQCSGKFTYKEHSIRCYGGESHGNVDFNKSFAKSCNGSFANMGLNISPDTFASTAKDLLFNKKLPFSLPYNKSSFKLQEDSGYPLQMQTAIGQGETRVSPLHMAMITSAVANKGSMMKPYLVDHVENALGEKIDTYSPEEIKQVMTEEESAKLMSLMELVVSEGTATKLGGQSYSAAGKTGTAEYTSDKDKTHAWFIGCSNTESPDLAVAVVAEGAGSGGAVAVPIAKSIFDAYYN